MLRTRVITGAVLTIILVAVLAFSHISWLLHIAIAFLSMLAVHELYSASGLQKSRVLYPVSLIAAALFSFLPNVPPMTIPLLLVSSFLVFGHLMRSVEKLKSIDTIEVVLLAFLTAFFFHTISDIRSMENGLAALIFAILCSIITDCAAYFVGRRIGRHKLAPVLSPKKTIEGSVGGVICTGILLTVTAIGLDSAGVLQVRYGALLAYLFFASVIGQFGDLAYSSVKRITGIKDYGKLLPGHGGILDRFDSMLFVLPFTYLFFSLWNIFG